MKEQIVQYETSKLLKEIGFNYPVINQYIGDKLYLGKDFTLCDPIDVNSDAKDRDVYSAPTQSLAQKFLREKYGIVVTIDTVWDYNNLPPIFEGYRYRISFVKYVYEVGESEICKTFDEALEKGIRKGIKIVKDGK